MTRRCIGYRLLSGIARPCKAMFDARSNSQRRCAKCSAAYKSTQWTKKVSNREQRDFERSSEPESATEVAHALAIKMLAGRL